MRKEYIIGIVVFGLILAGLHFTGVFNLVDGGQRCTIDTPGGSCEISFTLPADRAYSFFRMNMDFEKEISGEYSDYETVTHLQKRDFTEDKSRERQVHNFYLYPSPSSWDTEVGEVKMRSTIAGTSRCDRGEDSNLYGGNFIIKVPYSSNTIIDGDDRDCDRNAQCIIEYDRDRDGDRYVQYQRMSSESRYSVVDCYDDEDVSKTTTKENVFTNDLINSKGNELKFVLLVREDIPNEDAGSSDIDSVKVELAYRAATFPTDVSYSIGSKQIQTLSGEQRNNTNSLDIYKQLNDYCRRDINVGECFIPVTFTSSQPGTIIVTHEDIQNLAELPEDIPPPTQPPVDDETPSPTPEPESQQFNIPIIAIILGLVLIVVIVLFIKKRAK